jgi:polyketide synthase PksJ
LPCLQFGVFLPDVELFDAELFSVMRTEAVTMDPQQRLLLHAAHESLAQGGGAAAAFGRAVGAFVGIAGGYWWAV